MECGAELRLNRNLAETSVSCPECGSRVTVPAAPKKPPAKLALEPEPEPVREPVKHAKRPEPFTFYMMAAQSVLLALALTCFVAAFKPGDWKPPHWSWFAGHPLALGAFGIGFAFCAFMARYAPRLMALLAVLIVTGGIYLGHLSGHPVDASRTLALATALLAVWLAMEHRRFTRG